MPHIPLYGYAFIFLGLFALWILYRSLKRKGLFLTQKKDFWLLATKKDMKDLYDKVPTVLSGELVARVIAGMPTALSEEVARLTAERERLHKEIEEHEWVMVGVILHGLKCNFPDNPCRAPVLLNVKTGELRPAPEGQRFFTDTYDGGWWSSYCLPHVVPRTELGAPKWSKATEGSRPSILMLGVEYKYQ